MTGDEILALSQAEQDLYCAQFHRHALNVLYPEVATDDLSPAQLHEAFTAQALAAQAPDGR